MAWSVGDWAVFDHTIVQITEIRNERSCSVSDGSFNTSGNLLGRLRPLTLQNKRTIEFFDFYYRELNRIRGEGGFNYPSIHQHFVNLALQAIDKPDNPAPFDKAREFLNDARDYKQLIQGVPLFREASRA